MLVVVFWYVLAATIANPFLNITCFINTIVFWAISAACLCVVLWYVLAAAFFVVLRYITAAFLWAAFCFILTTPVVVVARLIFTH